VTQVLYIKELEVDIPPELLYNSIVKTKLQEELFMCTPSYNA
jgi:hypothetical protein